MSTDLADPGTGTDPEPADPTGDDMLADALDCEHQRRLWVRTITAVLALRSHDSDPSGRVQLAYDLLHVAACEAVCRLLAHVEPRTEP